MLTTIAVSLIGDRFMRINHITLGIAALIATSICYAAQDNAIIKEARVQVAKQYIQDLQNADYKDITQLFEKDGIVVSNSRGKVDAKEFFYSFLPNINLAKTELQQVFIGDTDKNRIAARFHFTYKLKDGEEGQGEYVDEFIFSDNSTKLSAVYMFENLKLENDTINESF